MSAEVRKIPLPDEDATRQLAVAVAGILRAGDVILLEGSIGTGKTFFARNVIQTILGVAEDVPSPTFTLVQVYDGPRCDIWHCDLYRLTHPDEAIELGLEEAFEQAICLIEWPDRLGSLRPENALLLSFSICDDVHQVAVSAHSDWQARWATLDV